MITTNSFDNKVAVVTGGSRGIGKAIALSLAEHNATLCLVGRDRETLEEVARSVRTDSRPAYCIVADVTRDDDLRKAVASIEQDIGHVDILIHCAGEYNRGDIETTPVDEFDLLYRTNVRGCYLLTQLLLPMLKKSQGQIVFINSSQGLNAGAHLSNYASTKHAMKGLADSLRGEVNPYGVRVLSLFAGRTATPLMRKIYDAEEKSIDPSLLLQPEDIAAVIINALGLPRSAEVTNISIRPLTKPY